MKETEQIAFRPSPLKKWLIIGLPVLATLLMSTGIYISRMNIDGWVRIYGNTSYKSGSRGAFRIFVRKGKLSTPVKKLAVEVTMKANGDTVSIGKAEMSHGEKALNVNTIFPKLSPGKYDLKWKIKTELGTQYWTSSVMLTDGSKELKRIYGEEGGGQNSNYSGTSSSSVSLDYLENAVSLHAYNGRGFRNRIRDILYIKAHTKDGEPLRIKGRLTVVNGIVRVPKSADCLPYLVKKELLKCMVEISDGQEIPFDMKTDALGLDSMTIYAMSNGVSFKIKYEVLEGPNKGKSSTVEYDVGGLEDDVFIGYFPRILPPEKSFNIQLTGLGSGPYWLDIFTPNQWRSAYTIPLVDYEGNFQLDTSSMFGMYKIQSSLSFVPISNSTANTTFWVHPYADDPKIIQNALEEALKIDNLDTHTKSWLSNIQKNGLVWKSGYNVLDDIHFFGGLLDRYHWSMGIIKDTKRFSEGNLSRTKRSGQTIILTIIAISGILLILTVFFAVYYSIRKRRESISAMSNLMADSDGNEHFWSNLHNDPDEIDARRKAVAFGVLIAAIVGFVIVATIWLMINIKWEM